MLLDAILRPATINVSIGSERTFPLLSTIPPIRLLDDVVELLMVPVYVIFVPEISPETSRAVAGVVVPIPTRPSLRILIILTSLYSPCVRARSIRVREFTLLFSQRQRFIVAREPYACPPVPSRPRYRTGVGSLRTVVEVRVVWTTIAAFESYVLTAATATVGFTWNRVTGLLVLTATLSPQIVIRFEPPTENPSACDPT